MTEIQIQNETKMNFRRVGGSYQLTVKTLDDLRNAVRLDEAHWALTSAAVDSFRTDPQFLAFLDDDRNGQIRTDEVKRAISWFLSLIRADASAELGTDAFPLTILDTTTEEGKVLYDAARVVLHNLGDPDSPTLSLDQIRNDKEIISRPCSNGDGVITAAGLTGDGVLCPDNLVNPSLADRIREIIAAVGSVKDLSGDDGIDKALLERYEQEAEAYLNWHDEPATGTTLAPFGADTASLYPRYSSLRERIDQYFLSCAALAFLPHTAERPVNLEAAADALNAGAVNTFLESITIAVPDAAGHLDLSGPLNPLYEKELRGFFAEPALRPFLEKKRLSASGWEQLKERFSPYEAWLAAKQGTAFDEVDPEHLRAVLTDGSLEQLHMLIDADLAVSRELSACETLLKLILFFRYLVPFLNNFVTLSNLFDPVTPAMLQTGKLVMDGRHFTLATVVKNIAEHKRIATLSDICVAYVEATSGREPDLKKMTLAVAITSGSMNNIFVGKRGIFLTPDGTLWDANVIDFIQQPVSVSEALKMPFHRFGEFMSKQADKFFSTKSANAQKVLETNIATGTLLPPATTGTTAQPPAVSGSMLLLGGGIGIAAIGSAVAFIVKSLQNISILNVLAVFAGIILIFGGPMVAISLVKLYRRNMSRFLEANACAVNRPMRLSRRMGSIFTFTPPLPKSSLIREDLVNVFHGPAPTHRLRTALLVTLAALLLAAAGWYTWRAFFQQTAAPSTTKQEQVKSAAPQTAAPSTTPAANAPAPEAASPVAVPAGAPR